jgi:DNA primase
MVIANLLHSRYHEKAHNVADVFDPLKVILDAAAEKYQYHLEKSPEVMNYLIHERGLTPKSIKHFGIGLAPEGFRRLLSQSKQKRWQAMVQRHLDTNLTVQEIENLTLSLMELTGLIATNGDSGEMYDRFRERVIIPIKDKHGQVISFGGRRTKENQGAKYINGSDSPLFNKGEVLFNLDTIHKMYLTYQTNPSVRRALPSIIVAEGYMDVIGMYNYEVLESVASMGTSLSKFQLETLFKYTDKIILCFDGDKPGVMAAQRAVEASLPLLTGNRNILITHLPNNHDPDSFLSEAANEYGTDQASDILREELNNGTPIAEYIIKMIQRTHNISWDNANLMSAYIIDKLNQMSDSSDVRVKIQEIMNNELHAGQLRSNNTTDEAMVDFVAETMTI